LIKGFLKRGKEEEELHYRAIIEKYS